MRSSPSSDSDFVDYRVLNPMNRGACDRRLASPVRLTLAVELGKGLDGAWWPHTASVARELPDLIGVLSARLGQIIDISVNWSSLQGRHRSRRAESRELREPRREISHQRLMMVTGSHARANLLVVPCRTSNALAVMVLRQAATLHIAPAERDTRSIRTADDIVRAARAESALCARRLPGELDSRTSMPQIQPRQFDARRQRSDTPMLLLGAMLTSANHVARQRC